MVLHELPNRTQILAFLLNINSFHLGNENIAELLIEHGADINLVNKDLIAPIHRAAERGNYFELERHIFVTYTD